MVGGIELVIMGFVVSMTAMMFWGLYDASRYPEHAWRAVGSDRSAWQLVIFFGGTIGTLIYLASVRPRLRQVPLALPTPAGWYPDPSGAALVRWYDGAGWTHHVAPMA